MYIRVHAVPKARKEKVVEQKSGTYTIWVKEPAERNLANKRIREILSETRGVELGKIKLLTGHQSSTKMYSVEEN